MSKPNKPTTPGEQARLDAGYKDHREVAALLNRHERTIRRAEMHGCANYDLAHSLAKLYGCSASVFLVPAGKNKHQMTESVRVRSKNRPSPARLAAIMPEVSRLAARVRARRAAETLTPEDLDRMAPAIVNAGRVDREIEEPKTVPATVTGRTDFTPAEAAGVGAQIVRAELFARDLVARKKMQKGAADTVASKDGAPSDISHPTLTEWAVVSLLIKKASQSAESLDHGKCRTALQDALVILGETVDRV